MLLEFLSYSDSDSGFSIRMKHMDRALDPTLLENKPDLQLCLEDGRDLGLHLGRRVLLGQGGAL